MSVEQTISEPRLLIVGFGRMGQLRSRLVQKKGFSWRWFDPNISCEQVSPTALNHRIERPLSVDLFTHAIISTPIKSHYGDWADLRTKGFVGPMLIEKPLSVSVPEVSEMLGDTSLHIGLTERKNPAVVWLRDQTAMTDYSNLLSIDFVRTSPLPESPISSVNVFEDLALHDIDILCRIWPGLEIEQPNLWLSNDGGSARATFSTNSGTSISMYWSRSTSHRERKVVARERHRTIVANLSRPAESSVFVNRGGKPVGAPLLRDSAALDPINQEVSDFLRGVKPEPFTIPHMLFAKLLDSKLGS